MRSMWELYEGAIPRMECEKMIVKCRQQCTFEDEATSLATSAGSYKAKRGWTEDYELMNLTDSFTRNANRKTFNLDVSYIPPIQLTQYDVGASCGWHIDVHWDTELAYDRKLSVVVQLCDPNSYEGGVFEFGGGPVAPKEFATQGSVLVFPSYLSHRVTEVTKGVRYSIVSWAEGPRWR